jgi:peptidase E
MSQIKSAFLLAGGRPHNPSSMAACLRLALAECGKAKPRVVYIGTASKDSLPFFLAMKALLQEAGAGPVDLLRLARPRVDVAAAKKTLLAADAIFLSGGEVEDGIDWLIRHDLADFLRDLRQQGTVFLGISAGSIMMGSGWVRWTHPDDDSTAKLFSCLNLVPYLFDTHAEDEDWRELKTALRLLGPGSRGYGIASGGMISADGEGHLFNVEQQLLVFANNDGHISRVE